MALAKFPTEEPGSSSDYTTEWNDSPEHHASLANRDVIDTSEEAARLAKRCNPEATPTQRALAVAAFVFELFKKGE